MKNPIPYPLSAARIDFSLNPFGFWFVPRFVRLNLTEMAKEQGEIFWYARWMWFQISYGRWV